MGPSPTSAGCEVVTRSTDPQLGDTRLWVLQCDAAPAPTDLSVAPDHPDR